MQRYGLHRRGLLAAVTGMPVVEEERFFETCEVAPISLINLSPRAWARLKARHELAIAVAGTVMPWSQHDPRNVLD